MPRRDFRLGESRPAGAVFWLPRELSLGSDPKHSRLHFLLHDCDDGDLPGDEAGIFATLAYMSTKGTEHTQYRAPAYRFLTPELQPVGGGQEGSFALTSRFLMVDVRTLSQASHQASPRDIQGCLASVRQGLGIGKGPAPPGGRSVRGHLARIEAPVRDVTGLEFGIVVTDHAYSGMRRYQAVVPLVDLGDLLEPGEGPDDFTTDATEFLVPRTDGRWTNAIPASWTAIVVDTMRLITLTEEWKKVKNPERWLKKQITVLPHKVRKAVLDEIDTRLVRRLNLPDGPAGAHDSDRSG
jgi:hypothetical protein